MRLFFSSSKFTDFLGGKYENSLSRGDETWNAEWMGPKVHCQSLVIRPRGVFEGEFLFSARKCEGISLAKRNCTQLGDWFGPKKFSPKSRSIEAWRQMKLQTPEGKFLRAKKEPFLTCRQKHFEAILLFLGSRKSQDGGLMLIRTLGICYRRVHFHLILAHIEPNRLPLSFSPYFTTKFRACNGWRCRFQASGNNFDFIFVVPRNHTSVTVFFSRCKKMPGPNLIFANYEGGKKNAQFTPAFQFWTCYYYHDEYARRSREGCKQIIMTAIWSSHECKCVTSNY